MKSARLSGQRGVSLIEVLIAVAILAALAAALAPALMTVGRTSSRIALFADKAEDARIARDVLSTLLSSVITFTGEADADSFAGGAEYASFTTLRGPAFTPQRVALAIEGETLFLEIVGDKRGASTTLIHGVTRLLYYGAETEGSKAGWRNEWKAALPPRLVRVQLASPKGSLSGIDFSVVTGAPLHCAFDQVSRRCRN